MATWKKHTGGTRHVAKHFSRKNPSWAFNKAAKKENPSLSSHRAMFSASDPAEPTAGLYEHEQVVSTTFKGSPGQTSSSRDFALGVAKAVSSVFFFFALCGVFE